MATLDLSQLAADTVTQLQSIWAAIGLEDNEKAIHIERMAAHVAAYYETTVKTETASRDALIQQAAGLKKSAQIIVLELGATADITDLEAEPLRKRVVHLQEQLTTWETVRPNGRVANCESCPGFTGIPFLCAD